MQTIFFYGLFMDAQSLQAMGFEPEIVGPAELPDYHIRIGNKSTLVAHTGACSYGIVMRLPDEQASALYSGPGVTDYLPEEVDVVLWSDRSVLKTRCYNLPPDKLDAGSNREYAAKLSRLALELGFPSAYADEILGHSSG